MHTNKDQAAILAKLGIEQLNEMQLSAHQAIKEGPEVILLSPTGTGKTLAFLLPIIANLDPDKEGIQALILVPSRELAIQIDQVAREMGSGYKINAIYGGRSGYKDKSDLKHPPAILIGTPGRIADHLERENISTAGISILVLDEFDKSLETGFEQEMRAIIESIPSLDKRILTSATQNVSIPDFVGLKDPKYLRFPAENEIQLSLKAIVADEVDELGVLSRILNQVGAGRGIVFCNLRDAVQEVSVFLNRKKIPHTSFYGGMDQLDREHALIKFRNGTHRILIATDLAARGLDVPALDFIIHYQIPYEEASFIHRNGRTARMNSKGTAYLILHKDKAVPSFAQAAEVIKLPDHGKPVPSEWATLYLLGGRKDKISKADIAGLFFKQGGLQKQELGLIELQQDCAYIAVPQSKAEQLVKDLNNQRLKKRKIRVSLLE